MPRFAERSWLTKAILTLCLIIVVSIGVVVDQTVLRALHPEQILCQVPLSAFISQPRNISFASSYDGLLLKGWFLPTPQKPARGTLVLAHGYRQNRLPEIPEAIELVNVALREGYNFLLFDFRNCGESNKSITTFGLLESYDLTSAVEYIHNLEPNLPIYVLGISMGAAAAVLAAERSQHIKALIVDSSFADLKQYLSRHLPTWTGLPQFPFTFLMLSAGPRSAGLDIASVSPLRAAAKVTQPVLVIHSRKDQRVPLSEGINLYAALAGTNKQLWIVPDSDHATTFAKYSAEYQKRILSFLEKVDS